MAFYRWPLSTVGNIQQLQLCRCAERTDYSNKLELVTRVQILHEAVYIPLDVNSNEKGINMLKYV